MNNPVESRGESRFRLLFERAPVAIWDEDFSAVKELLDGFFSSGVTDIRQHLESNPGLVTEVIGRVRVRHVNRLAREFYGAETEEDLIRALPTLFDSAAVKVFIDEIAALAHGASTFSAELMAATLKGERRLVQMNVSVLRAEDDDWSQVVVTFTDLTERRRLEQSLQLANEKLLRVNSDLEQFAYAAAHDLSEPLRTIALYAQLLQKFELERLGPTADMALSSILQNTSRMRTLVGDLLTFAQMAEPQVPARCPLVDSRAVVTEVLASIAGAIKEAGACVVVSPSLPAVPMQAGHLRQVFQNLIVNGIKYCSQDRVPEVSVTATREDCETVFCVTDNGIGISRDYHTRIFGIFNRLQSMEVEGSGIGLALCKEIVERYGGRIWVESQLDVGSKFYFTIPAVLVEPL